MMFSMPNKSLSSLITTFIHNGNCSVKYLMKDLGKASVCMNSSKSSAVSWVSEHPWVLGFWLTVCLCLLTLRYLTTLSIDFFRDGLDSEKLYPVILKGIVLLSGDMMCTIPFDIDKFESKATVMWHTEKFLSSFFSHPIGNSPASMPSLV